MDGPFSICSSAFVDGGVMPSKYTCDGDRLLAPPLLIGGIPDGTKSLALTMDDPDIPQEIKDARGIEVFDHWVLFNITASAGTSVDMPEGGPLVAASGLNSAGTTGYTGPCPPPEYEPREHRYFFTVYALRDTLVFHEPPTKQEVLAAIQPLAIAKARLVGRYARQ